MVLDEKHFRNVDNFDGSEEAWGNWFFKLMTQIAGASAEAAEVVERVMASKDAATWDKVKVLAAEGIRYDGELFRVVAGLTTGDASTVVRSAAMGEGGKSGLWALKQLQKRCNPRTIGRRLKAMLGVVAPVPVKNMGEVVRKVEEWELAVKKVEAEYGEVVPCSMQVAVLISMLPKELQDIAFQLSKDGEELDYKEVRGRVLGVAMNRMQERVPQMGKSVYGVCERWDWGAGEDDLWGCEAEVDALGKGNV